MPTPLGVLCGLLLTLLIVQNIAFWRFSGDTAPRLIPHPSKPLSLNDPSIDEEWRFLPARDANNIALTSVQCDTAFPKLYAEIDRSVKLWRDRQHPITAQDTSIQWRRDAAFRLLIHNNSLRILETKGAMNDAYRPRTLAVMHQLHNALLGAKVSGEILPTIEFAVTVDDMSLIPNGNDTHAIWAFTRRLIDRDQDRCWLMPEFDFWAGPEGTGSFYEAGQRARRHDAGLADKTPKAVWRGVAWTNPPLREGLLLTTKGKTWADVAETVWENGTNFMALEDLCDYAFVIHTEGRSWSGRLKYLLNCDSVPIVHELDWTTHYYHLLVPKGADQNFVPVHRDWTDLEKKVEHYLHRRHLLHAQEMVERARVTFRERYLTAAAEACYWRRLVKGYGEVAVLPRAVESVSGGGERLRGISFEEFVWGATEWPVPVLDGG
ncbi:hypothetical protein B0A55_03394 [Friedmanniomyces simplex]|uniref:Glycosyl transferase CAP10 domain-containing protein n=1 Tax=Friedmanniomyces simplex TaxID=329884 RepID=A0A4U0XZ16_9PEZI|nr:hypothetical protein B0A55_03394 [Friedmanniomyces simplex]